MLGNAALMPNLHLGVLDMRYRRAKTPGATYFFTVVTFGRRRILCQPDNVELLRAAFKTVKSRHPFIIDAIVVLPDHLHCLWTMPSGDNDYPMRWNAIKIHFTRYCAAEYKIPASAARKRKREHAIWQRRYWEHEIRDDLDFERHCDYIHWNPVKHGLVIHARDWPYSSFHRFVNLGVYSHGWAGLLENTDADEYGE